ncbi:MAG: type IV pilus secretin PilQ [Pseudomonadota bacterium]
MIKINLNLIKEPTRMKHKIYVLAASLVFGLTMLNGAAHGATLDDIDFTSLPGDRVQINLRLSEPVAEPLSFTIDNPARIAIDLPGTDLNLENRAVSIGVGNAEAVAAVATDDKARVVINLTQLVPYELETNDNVITLTLEGNPASIETDAVVSTPTLAGGASGASINDVDFRRGEGGEAQIIVDLSDPDVAINISEQGGKIIVDFSATALPEALDRRLDVIDFATPAKIVDTFNYGNGTRMEIEPLGSYEHLAYQSDNVFTIELRPLTAQEEDELRRDKFGFTGERLSLNFQNIEVRAVLQLIADFTEKNLVASDTVGGNVTLRLKNVPWDQALDIILKSKGLGVREMGNVLMVAPQEEIAAREKLELEAQQQIQELAPLRTEFMQINYAKADAISALLKAEENNLLSERGNVSIDERTNTLLIQDTVENLVAIRKVVEALDVPVRQVLIESRIVLANEDFSKDLGVRFGYSHVNNPKAFAVDPVTGKSDLTTSLGGGLVGNTDFGAPTSFNTDGIDNFIVDLPVAGPAGALQFAVGRIGSYLLQLELQALQAEGRGEVISSPRVITANQQEATIQTGTQIPYLEAASSGATSVSFQEAVLSLTVTPQITPDDRVIMDLSVTNDAIGQVFTGVPSIDTQQVTTQVLVDNGETVVLGGIYQSTNRDDSSKVPFFADLPYLGALFKNSQVERSKSELLVFVTPKILKESLSLSGN